MNGWQTSNCFCPNAEEDGCPIQLTQEAHLLDPEATLGEAGLAHAGNQN